ncbi:phosphoribosylamine--glycine ligase [Nitrospira sp.]|nr:phosphoribosylamine--glycine ligase [Nitrospira sp.]
MKVLVVGSGGREHTIAWKLAQSPRVSQVYCAPGNGGIAAHATCVPLPADDVAGLQAFVQREGIDLTVVGPEAPLAAGIVDEFRKAKLKIFGPTRAAAQVEASKIFTKELLRATGVATARAASFDRLEAALEYLQANRAPIVIKADGLAQGKGVVVATTDAQAEEAVRDVLEKHVFGSAGARVLIEEFLDGEELTVMAFTDGKTVIPLIPAQDHKRVGDGDEGPNTGGMGAYAPAPLGNRDLLDRVTRTVLHPTVAALSRMGRPFQGVLYAGLMVVNGTPYVLEFNARMGDPETQAVLPLLKTDLLDIVEAVVEHRLDQIQVEWHPGAAVCVVMTAPGYPGTYPSGAPIRGLPLMGAAGAVTVFHAGTKQRDTELVTSGGRVLGVTAVGTSIADARERVYHAVRGIHFEGCHFRTDIALRALRLSLA